MTSEGVKVKKPNMKFWENKTPDEYKKIIAELRGKYPEKDSGEQIARLAGQVILDYCENINKGILRASNGFDDLLTKDIIKNSNFSIKGNESKFFSESIDLLKKWSDLEDQLLGKWNTKEREKPPEKDSDAEKNLKAAKQELMNSSNLKKNYIDPSPPQELITMLLPIFHEFINEYKKNPENVKNKEPEQVESDAERQFMIQIGFSIFNSGLGNLPPVEQNKISKELKLYEKSKKGPNVSLKYMLGELLVDSVWVTKLREANKNYQPTAQLQVVEDAKNISQRVKNESNLEKFNKFAANGNYDELKRLIPKMNDLTDWDNMLKKFKNLKPKQIKELTKLKDLTIACGYFLPPINLKNISTKTLMSEVAGKTFMEIVSQDSNKLKQEEQNVLIKDINERLAQGYSPLPNENRIAQQSIKDKFTNNTQQVREHAFLNEFDSLVPMNLTKEKVIKFSNKYIDNFNYNTKNLENAINDLNKLDDTKEEEIVKQINKIYIELSEIKKVETNLLMENNGFDLESVLKNCCPIHELIKSKSRTPNSILLLDFICQNKSPDFVNQKNPEGITPLQLAIREKNAEAVKILIKRGANLDNVKINNDIIALHDEKIIELLCDKGKFEYLSFSRILTDGSHSQFRHAIMSDKTPAEADKNNMNEYINRAFSLKDSGIDPMTPLQHAASQGDEEYIKKLISTHKADVNKGKPTPLEKAFKQGNFACITRLINAGANIPPELISTKMGNENYTIVHYAARNGYENLLKKLLASTDNKVFSELNSSGLTPLQEACSAGKSECVKLLVEKLSPNEINAGHSVFSKMRPIEIALEQGDIESVKILSAYLPKEVTDGKISAYPRTTPQKIWDVLTKGGPSTWNNPPKRKIGEIVKLLGIKSETSDINKISNFPEIPNVSKSTPGEDAKIIKLNNILKNKDETTRDINKEISENRKEPLLNMRQKTTLEKASSVVNSNHIMVLRIIKDLLQEKLIIDNKPKKNTTDLFKIDAINAQVNDLNKISDYLEVNKNVTLDQFLERVNETLKTLDTSYESIKKKYPGLKISDQLETISTKAQGRLNAVKDELSAVFTVGTRNKINEIIRELNEESKEMEKNTEMQDYEKQARDKIINVEIEALNKISDHLKGKPTAKANDEDFLTFVNQTIKQAQEKTKDAYGNSTFSARTRELFTDLSEPALPLEAKRGPSEFAENNMKEIKLILNKLPMNDPGAQIEIKALEKVLTRLEEKPTISAKNVKFSKFVKQTLDEALIEKKKTTGSRYNHENALSVETESLLRNLSVTANNAKRKNRM